MLVFFSSWSPSRDSQAEAQHVGGKGQSRLLHSLALRVCVRPSSPLSQRSLESRRRRPTSSSTVMTKRQIYQKALLITSLGTVKRYFARFFNVIENIISFLKVILHIAAFCFRCIWRIDDWPRGNRKARKNRLHNETIKRNANKKNMQIFL